MTVFDLGQVGEHRGARDGRGETPDRPFRAPLTLRELHYIADQLGVSLPFQAPEQTTVEALLEQRLGDPTTGTDGGSDAVLDKALASLPDPETSLLERRLATVHIETGDVVLAAPLERVLVVLAQPDVTVAIDAAFSVPGDRPVRVRVHHHVDAAHLASLASIDGVVWEAALLPLGDWPGELARVATPPDAYDDTSTTDGTESGVVVLPFVLMTVGCELIETDRGHLLPPLLEDHTGQTIRDGVQLPDAEVEAVLRSVSRPVGRLRALVARAPDPVDAEVGLDGSHRSSPVVGVLTWVLTPTGWRSLDPCGTTDDPRVRVTSQTPADLSPAVARLVAEVLS